jgi:hypothetical protein
MEQAEFDDAGGDGFGPEALEPMVSEPGEGEQLGAEVHLERREGRGGTVGQ